ncbi:anthocyanidin 3-O-glucosyltransferase 2-like [Malania oleifera]|uniref:anthocyanidin 3-O-glucosyltransferase 2-like n=1 Tax=Malania oleifera TaxID=397392 RepID=UPI0025ADDE5F|nr:anthocyanidin 3-O-glucosyltransferase 2-like [Malania oleifera]
MKKAELMFIPFPAASHIVSMVEIAKLLTHRYPHLSATVLIIHSPFPSMTDSYIKSISAASTGTGGIKFLNLPPPQQTPDDPPAYKSSDDLVSPSIPKVRAAVAELSASPGSAPVAGFVVDLICTLMMDLAKELGLPSYVFVPSGAAFLGLVLHFQTLRDDHHRDVTEFTNSDAELVIPCFANPVPARVLPSFMVDKDGASTAILNSAKRLRESKGILVNTCVELESNTINTLNTNIGIDGTPPIYPVGPILNLTDDAQKGSSIMSAQKGSSIMSWLDDQPPSSVVFLCFGSMGSFSTNQVREIALALELSGRRFLWSLRMPPPSTVKNNIGFPTDYDNPEEVLPKGFLERTAGIGKVIGWAPQVAVLAHRAVGGFVSHCGWNSILESMWYGVPIATWPMYAEQQLNAFVIARELGLGVEIKIDYKDNGDLVNANEIERGIRGVMEGDEVIRKNVKEMREKIRKALTRDGSSYVSFGQFVQQMMCD